MLRNMKSNFERLNELVLLHPEDERSRFYNFWEGFDEFPDRVRAFSSLENELSLLDIAAWSFLKKEVESLVLKKDDLRGRNQLVEKLNEAKGYCFLRSLDCSKISFIPRSKIENIETPDLQGWKENSLFLVEVKTLNKSLDLLLAGKNGYGMSSSNKLTPELTEKLKSIFFKAASQLNAYSQLSNIKKYIYLIASYDDETDYRDELNIQTRELFNSISLEKIELIIHGA